MLVKSLVMKKKLLKRLIFLYQTNLPLLQMVVAQIWLQHSTSLDTVLQENSYLFIQWKNMFTKSEIILKQNPGICMRQPFTCSKVN